MSEEKKSVTVAELRSALAAASNALETYRGLHTHDGSYVLAHRAIGAIGEVLKRPDGNWDKVSLETVRGQRDDAMAKVDELQKAFIEANSDLGNARVRIEILETKLADVTNTDASITINIENLTVQS